MKILFSNLISAFSPSIHLFVFLALIINFFSVNPVGAVDPYFQLCNVPRRCGNQTIRFPFYIKRLEGPVCGYPGFDLSCDDVGRSILYFSGEIYVVRQIFYQNQSLLVSNTALSDPEVEYYALNSLRNLSLPVDFVLVPNQKRVFLRYSCADPSISNYVIGVDNENYYFDQVLAIPEDDKVELNGTCGAGRVVVVPARYWGKNKEMSMREVLSRGFMLNWRAKNCTLCESTGGRCGFDNHFKCYCPDKLHAAHCDDHVPGISRDIKAAIAIASTVVGIGILVLLILCHLRKKSLASGFIFFFWKKHNQTYENVEAFLRNYGPLQVRTYSYSDINKMTNSFREKLGQGGFGNVYKGKLDNGCPVAVKALNKSKGDDGEDFINEVATISKTSHVNVVTMLGFCFEGAKKALIYEFMPNGSLEKFIFDENASKKSNELDWETYYQISLGIARGLEYLHRGCNARILHFDIKPHNILLDADFVPKISDFGLAKICTKKESLISLLGPRGTIGYIAPEIFSRNFGGISHKSDVYSYGMMVLEMVGGRKNVNIRVDNTSEIYFPYWIYQRLEFDEELRLKRTTNEEDKVKVKKMIIVSSWCIQTDPSDRPAMSRVIEMLEGSLASLEIPPRPFLSSSTRLRLSKSSSSFVPLEI